MMGQEQARRMIDLEEGWAFVRKGITRLTNILEGKPEPYGSTWIVMILHGKICDMCTQTSQRDPHYNSQQLYHRYRESFEEYITTMVSTC